MIISASRRTDIPAFYARWFINRIRAGYCLVPNPFNRRQISRVDLTPQSVDVIVFWTRNPLPLFPYLDELDRSGYRYYFQYTLMDYPGAIEPHSPTLESAVRSFRKLSAAVGAEKVIWRYDPILLTSLTNATFHAETYQRIAEALNGCTHRSVISLYDPYPKIVGRLKKLSRQGYVLHDAARLEQELQELIPFIQRTADQNGMQLYSCAEEHNLMKFGVPPGKCIDDALITRLFGIQVSNKKDPSQRKACGCVTSKDIGMYETCIGGCQYCYAVSSFEAAEKNRGERDE